MPKVHSLFRFPGGKQKFSKHITGRISDFIAEHQDYEYRETFAGSLGTGLALLSQPHVKRGWINDKDFGVASIWNAVLNKPDALCQLIEQFKPTAQAFYEFKEYLKQDPRISTDDFVVIGFRKLAIHQISYSGLGTMSGGPLGGDDQKSDYKIDCRWNAKTLVRKVKVLHHLLKDKLRNAVCSWRDVVDMLEAPGKAFFYLDPPYYVNGPELYEKSFTEEDHKRLSDALKEVDQPWILSYDDCEEIRALYEWAIIIDFQMNYTITTSRQKSELLIVSPKFSELAVTETLAPIQF